MQKEGEKHLYSCQRHQTAGRLTFPNWLLRTQTHFFPQILFTRFLAAVEPFTANSN